MIISLDTETTGTDLYHEAKPFLVTICDKEWNNYHWEWEVNPITRQPQIVHSDLEEIAHYIETADTIALQNSKFDVTALMRTDIGKLLTSWPWHKVVDTLIAGHLLASNHSKDLSSMAVEYLAIDISKYEEELKRIVKAARSLVQRTSSPIRNWYIATKDMQGFPSIKSEETWKNDLWLPKTVALLHPELIGNEDEVQQWEAVTSDYANIDSSTTLALWFEQKKIIEQRGLTAIYQERLKLLPIAYEMEKHGVTLSSERLSHLLSTYKEESQSAGRICLNIAKSYGFDLELPKSGANNSLREFLFEYMKLPPIRNNKKKKTLTPDLDKLALEEYKETLPSGSKPKLFIEKLAEKRKRDTAISYMTSYQKFALPLNVDSPLGPEIRRDIEWLVLHPNLNLTGTDTLRFSSSNPNEQNISKQEGFNLRFVFGPPLGREWWSLDAKNIELRIPAYESGEQELISLFKHPDDPPYYGSTHLLNFHTVYPDIWNKELAEVGLEKVGPHCKKKYAATWYQWVKNGGFATQYGAVDKSDGTGTADKAFHKPGAHALLKTRFNKLERLNQRCIRQANELGYVETMPDKTIEPNRGYPLLCTRSQWGHIKPTVPLNYHVQSTAMWWMGRAMVRCQEQLDQWRAKKVVDAWIVLQVHDELVFDFPKGKGEESWKTNLPLINQLAKLMEMGGDAIGVPTPVGIEYNPDNWSEGKTLK